MFRAAYIRIDTLTCDDGSAVYWWCEVRGTWTVQTRPTNQHAHTAFRTIAATNLRQYDEARKSVWHDNDGDTTGYVGVTTR